MTLRETAKAIALVLATIVVTPALVSYAIRARVFGRHRALEGSTQALACVPGMLGQYVRRAFLCQILGACHPSATIEFGTIFSDADARIEAEAYVGPHCHLGRVHIERGALLAPSVHIPSGARTHGIDGEGLFKDQPGESRMVRIGAGAWIGAGAVVMTDVGRGAVVGAGAVVTRVVPDGVLVAGVPARLVRTLPGYVAAMRASSGRE